MLEHKAPLPSQVAKAIPKPFAFRGMTITGLAGIVQKSGDEFILIPRGSNQKFVLQAGEAIKKRLGDGPSMVAVSGKVDESPAKEGQTPLPVIHVTEVRENPAK